MTSEQEREAFEAWKKRNRFGTPDEAWMARASLSASTPSAGTQSDTERDAARQLRKALGISQDFDDWSLATLMTKAAERIAAMGNQSAGKESND